MIPLTSDALRKVISEDWPSPALGSEITLQRLASRRLLVIRPAVFGLLTALPTVTHKMSELERFEIVPAFTSLFWQQANFDKDHLICVAGLEDLVAVWLEQQGYRVRRVNMPEPLAAPSLAFTGDHPNPYDSILLCAIQQHDRAWFRLGPSVDPAWLIAQAALAWPDKQIAVCATRRKEAKRVAKFLTRCGLSVTLMLDGEPDQSERIFVSTFSRCGSGVSRMNRRDMVFVLHADEAACQAGKRSLAAAGRARVYGFVPQGQRLAPREQDFVITEFGQPLVLPAHGQRELDIAVASTRIAGGPLQDKDRDLLGRLRHRVWHHPVRNRRVAALAKALAGNRRQVLKKQFRAVFDQLGMKQRPRVMVLVENIEHGLALADSLPTWPFVVRDAANIDWLSVEQQDRLTCADTWDLTGASPIIVTPSAITQLPAPDVLIRADAGVDLPVLSGDLTVPQDASQKRLLVVDCCDAHDPVLLQRSRRRKKAYAAAGWLSQDQSWGARALQAWGQRHRKVVLHV